MYWRWLLGTQAWHDVARYDTSSDRHRVQNLRAYRDSAAQRTGFTEVAGSTSYRRATSATNLWPGEERNAAIVCWAAG